MIFVEAETWYLQFRENFDSKLEKSSKVEHDKESLISLFASFFTAITKVD